MTPAGRGSGWCCHSSASTRSTSPERERGQRLLGLRLDELAAQPRRLVRERLHRGQGELQRGRLEGRDAAAPGHVARGRGELGLRELDALEQRAGVPDEHERGIGEPHAAARRLEQRHAGLALEHRQLLRHGRGRELQRVGHGGDRAARVQLVQEPQPVQVERH